MLGLRVMGVAVLVLVGILGPLTNPLHLGVDLQGGIELTLEQEMWVLEDEAPQRDSAILRQESRRVGWSEFEATPGFGRMEITSRQPLLGVIPFVAFNTPGYALVESHDDVHVFEMTEGYRTDLRSKADRKLFDQLQLGVARSNNDAMSVERLARGLIQLRLPGELDVERISPLFHGP